jgi:hypothetical protein
MSKDFLAALEERWPEAAKRVRSQLPNQPRQIIESASRVEWVHLRHHSRLNEVALGQLGLERYQQGWRQAMLRSVRQKTLRATVSGALRLFGASPASLMKLAPRAWNLLARNAGTLDAAVELEAKRGQMTLTEFPEEYSRDGSFAQGLVGCIEAFLDICETQGEVLLASSTPRAGRALYTITWR